MPNDRPILVELFRHNLWANGVMLDACRDLSDEQLATELAGTYGRLDRTLVHLARAQGGYLRTLTDWQPGTDHRLEYDNPFPGVDRIAETPALYRRAPDRGRAGCVSGSRPGGRMER